MSAATAESDPRVAEIKARMIDRLEDLADRELSRPEQRGAYDRALDWHLKDQVVDARDAAALLESADRPEEAAAMEAYRDCLRDAAASRNAAPSWRPTQASLSASMDRDQMRKLRDDPRIKSAAAASKEQALLVWKPGGEPDQTVAAARSYQSGLEEYQQRSSIVEIEGELTEYDRGYPIRSAVHEVMSDQQRLDQETRMLDAQLRLSQPVVTAQAYQAFDEVQEWNRYGAPLPEPEASPHVTSPRAAAGPEATVHSSIDPINTTGQRPSAGPGVN